MSEYDDAWKTPGWTAQNMAYPAGSGAPTITPVPLPQVRVFGEFRALNGFALQGLVTAMPSQRITVFEGKEVALPIIRQELINGKADFEIPTGDWSWEITQRIGPTTRVSTVSPTADVDLSTL